MRAFRILRTGVTAVLWGLFGCLGLGNRAMAQLPDIAFDPNANDLVNGVLVQPGGNVLVSGYFTGIAGEPYAGIARLLSDGSDDPAFEPDAITGLVFVMAQQTDGKILIGGNFTNVGTPPRNFLARIASDGSLDTGFDPGSGTNEHPYAIAFAPDGKVLVAGAFTVFAGTPRVRVVRLHTDGSLDTSFDTDIGPDNTVLALAVEPVGADYRVLIGGLFTNVDGTPRNHIARLSSSGALDSTYDPGASGWNGHVRAMVREPDGQLLVGGDFTFINFLERRGIVRLNADGAVDTGFTPGSGANGFVLALALQTDGKVLLGGSFTTVGGKPRNNIARLNANGTLDTAFIPGAGATGTAANVLALAAQPDGKVVFGGNFGFVDGVPRNHIARLLVSDHIFIDGFD